MRTSRYAQGLCLGLACAHPALARVHIDPEREAQIAKEPPPVVAPPPEQRGYTLAASAGYFGGLVLGYGAQVLYRRGTWELGLSGYYGSADVGSSVSGQISSDPLLEPYRVDSLRITSNAFGLITRYYFYGNSAIGVGLGLRQIKGQVRLSADDGSSLQAQAAVTAVYASAAIGTYWTWDSGFYAGADWVGISFPVLNKYSDSTSTTGVQTAGVAAAFQSQVEDLTKTIASSPELILLLVAVGYRF